MKNDRQRAQLFSIELWAKEIHREFKKMADEDSLYNVFRRAYRMGDKQIIAYHVNDNLFHIPAKIGDFHHPETRWMWGNVITNKACRTNNKFAMLFCPEGTRMNWITHATFKMLARSMKHEYINPWSADQIVKIKAAIPSLTRFQAHLLFDKLIKHPAFHYSKNVPTSNMYAHRGSVTVYKEEG
jgi:hypothetical protein